MQFLRVEHGLNSGANVPDAALALPVSDRQHQCSEERVGSVAAQ